MAKKCNYRNPLTRDGISRTTRVLKAIDPEQVKIDDREITDLINEAADLARLIKYWDTGNNDTITEDSISREMNWAFLFENDTALLAAISAQDMRLHHDQFQNQLIELLGPEGTTIYSKDDFKPFLEQLFDLSKEVDNWFSNAKDAALKEELLRVIRAQAGKVVQELIEYDHAAVYALNTSTSPTFTLKDYTKFSPEWGVSSYVFPTDPAEQQAIIDRLYGTPANTTISSRILFAIDGIKRLFAIIINARQELIEKAKEAFEERLQNFPEHEPHFALFLTFLKLFRHAQDHINILPRLHLDYYYRDVLRLTEKAEVPDRVHLLFELAKNVSTHLLPAGTQFKAGKDKTGADIIFKTDHEIVLNKAQVGSLKTVFLDKDPDGNVSTVYAAPVANSSDGKGAPLKPEAPRWKMFGEPQGTIPRTMTKAEIGFAIASPILQLSEGTRVVTITLTLKEGFLNNLLSSDTDEGDIAAGLSSSLDIYFSSANGWIKPDNRDEAGLGPYTLQQPKVIVTTTTTTTAISPSPSPPPNTIRIVTELSSALPAVAASLVRGQFRTQWPVVKFIAKPGSNAYHYLRFFKVMKYTIDVDVREVKKLILQNDQGLLTSAMYPFTALPARGKNFYIGSQEVFSKKLDYLKLNIEWLDVPTNNFQDYYEEYLKPDSNKIITGTDGQFHAKLELLDNYQWKNIADDISSQLTSGGYIRNPRAATLHTLLYDTEAPGTQVETNLDKFVAENEETVTLEFNQASDELIADADL